MMIRPYICKKHGTLEQSNIVIYKDGQRKCRICIKYAGILGVAAIKAKAIKNNPPDKVPSVICRIHGYTENVYKKYDKRRSHYTSYRCKICTLGATERSRKKKSKNSEYRAKQAEKMRKYRTTQNGKEIIQKMNKKRHLYNRDNLTDTYIKNLLIRKEDNLSAKDISPDIIKAKRSHLLLKRKLKGGP